MCSLNPDLLSVFHIDVLHWSRNEPSQVLCPCCPGQEFYQPLGKMIRYVNLVTLQSLANHSEVTSSNVVCSVSDRSSGWDP